MKVLELRLVAGAEDGGAVVEKEEQEEEEEEDADRGAAEAVDGVWLAGGEDVGEGGASVGGEEADEDEEDDGEEKETGGAEEAGDGVGNGLSMVTDEERTAYYYS